MDTTNQANESYYKNFEFEMDDEVKQTYRGALKIFGSDPSTIKKIANKLLLFGIIIDVITLKALIAFLTIFRINLLTVIFAVGFFLIYTSVYLKKNISKLPVVIVYPDKILFKKQKYFGKLKFLSFYHLIYSKEFDVITKDDIVFVALATGIFNTGELIFESISSQSKVYAILNVEKDYLNHIAQYLTHYIES
jgi:hypothetical protein